MFKTRGRKKGLSPVSYTSQQETENRPPSPAPLNRRQRTVPCLRMLRNQKDSPLSSGLNLLQDALFLAVPVVDGFKRLAEQRCHKPDDESAVYPADLFEPF